MSCSFEYQNYKPSWTTYTPNWTYNSLLRITLLAFFDGWGASLCPSRQTLGTHLRHFIFHSSQRCPPLHKLDITPSCSKGHGHDLPSGPQFISSLQTGFQTEAKGIFLISKCGHLSTVLKIAGPLSTYHRVRLRGAQLNLNFKQLSGSHAFWSIRI